MRGSILAVLAPMLWMPFAGHAQEGTASLTGAVIDPSGSLIPHATVELDSGASKYQVQTDDGGAYRFSNLKAGEYTLRFLVQGFKIRTVKYIALFEKEEKRIPDVTLTVGSSCDPSTRDLVPLPPGILFGQLSGSVVPPVADVEVTLVCRTFTKCRSTKTDSNGRFSFDMLSAGVYGLNFGHDGFYPVNATGYDYAVDEGWESAYSPRLLQQCPKGNCTIKLRPQRNVARCE